jgi:hypothetical protein
MQIFWEVSASGTLVIYVFTDVAALVIYVFTDVAPGH